MWQGIGQTGMRNDGFCVRRCPISFRRNAVRFLLVSTVTRLRAGRYGVRFSAGKKIYLFSQTPRPGL
jgi:hypothetical protein